MVEDRGGKAHFLVGSFNSIPGLPCLSPGTCTIRILPRVETQGLSQKDVPELTETVRQAMADALAEMSADRCGDRSAEGPLFPHCVGAGAGMRRDSPQHNEDTTGTGNQAAGLSSLGRQG